MDEATDAALMKAGATIERLQRERDEARAAIHTALPLWYSYRIEETMEMRHAYERLRAALGGEG